jgi:hypothetical protein
MSVAQHTADRSRRGRLGGPSAPAVSLLVSPRATPASSLGHNGRAWSPRTRDATAQHRFDRIAVYPPASPTGPARFEAKDAGVADAADSKGVGAPAAPDAGAVPAAGPDAGIPAAPDAGVAAPPAAAPVAITWSSSYASDAGNDSSTTTEQSFTATYDAVADAPANLWRLQVKTIAGGVDIAVHTDRWRDAGVTPPVNAREARAAVRQMKGYYARGSAPVGSWHTEAASRAHEEHHYDEWKCAGDHYWPATQTALEKLTAPLAAHGNAAAAVTAMRAGASGADAKLVAFKAITRRYWMTLADNASSRPFAAGQLALNPTIQGVQALATAKGWARVPAGVDTPSKATPCYEPWLPYAP